MEAPPPPTWETSGTPGGYRLVSTYNLPDCKTILKFEIWSFSEFWGGVFWNSPIWTLWQFSFRGVFCTRTWTLWQFSFWGGILYSDLDSLTIFILGGGGYSVFQNRGILPQFGPKFQPLQQVHASQIVLTYYVCGD